MQIIFFDLMRNQTFSAEAYYVVEKYFTQEEINGILENFPFS